jgi:hypothetical protein
VFVCLFGFTVHKHNIVHMMPEQEFQIPFFANQSGVTNFKAAPGVKTTTPAGAKRCRDFIYSNPFEPSHDKTNVMRLRPA